MHRKLRLALIRWCLRNNGVSGLGDWFKVQDKLINAM